MTLQEVVRVSSGRGECGKKMVPIIVNAQTAGFFESSRGLPQGDPLSPYLLIMDQLLEDPWGLRADKRSYGDENQTNLF